MTVIVAVGEILFDIFPDYQRMGGAPFNFAYHLKSLGFEVCFISRIGNDQSGKAILQALHDKQFDTDHIQIDDIHATGKVLIKLQENGNAQFNILPDVAYDYIECDQSIESVLSTAEILYFGSLIQRSECGFQNLRAMISAKGGSTRCLYDVNLRPNSYNDMIIRTSLQHSNVVKLNNEELSVIKQFFSFSGSPEAFIETLMREFDLDMVSLTMGDAGSVLYAKNGYYSVMPQKNLNVVDTVGAGDGYAAVLAIGYLQKWHPEKILKVATEFAGRICEIEGAIPSESGFYKDFRLKMIS